MLRPWCHKILGTDCASRPRMTGGRGANSFGRSMIEMLGVLAIIGVLSVGGIAGYSKAMMMWKINVAINQYAHIIQGMIENQTSLRVLPHQHIDELLLAMGIIPESWNFDGTYIHDNLGNTITSYVNHMNEKTMTFEIYFGNSAILLREVVFAKNLVPDTWKSEEGNARTGMMDPYGNYVRVFSRNSRLVFDVYIGNIKNNESGQLVSDSFSPQFCFALMQDIVVPLHEIINYVWFTGNSTNYYGDRYCGSNSKCISALSLNDLNRLCNYCEKDKSCGLILEF